MSLTLKGDTATLGTDTGAPIEVSTDGGTTWTPVTPGSDGKFTATVPAGSENGVKVRVPTINDGVTEGDETLTLEAAAKGQAASVTGTGTIADGSNVDVNDAPTGTDKTFTQVPAASDTLLKVEDFGFKDPQDNPPNNLKAVIFEKPSAGELKVDGVAINGTTTVSAADIAAGKVVYNYQDRKSVV